MSSSIQLKTAVIKARLMKTAEIDRPTRNRPTYLPKMTRRTPNRDSKNMDGSLSFVPVANSSL